MSWLKRQILQLGVDVYDHLAEHRGQIDYWKMGERAEHPSAGRRSKGRRKRASVVTDHDHLSGSANPHGGHVSPGASIGHDPRGVKVDPRATIGAEPAAQFVHEGEQGSVGVENAPIKAAGGAERDVAHDDLPSLADRGISRVGERGAPRDRSGAHPDIAGPLEIRGTIDVGEGLNGYITGVADTPEVPA